MTGDTKINNDILDAWIAELIQKNLAICNFLSLNNQEEADRLKEENLKNTIQIAEAISKLSGHDFEEIKTSLIEQNNIIFKKCLDQFNKGLLN